MIHESNKVNDLVITKSKMSFQVIYSKPYFPKGFEQDLKKANLLLLPNEEVKNITCPVFPEQTMEFHKFMKHFESNALIGDICISDEDYVELELHSDLITLPCMIVTMVILPVCVNLISDYLNRKIQERKSETDLKVKVNITVVDGENSKQISYEGDARVFEKTIKSANEFNV